MTKGGQYEKRSVIAIDRRLSGAKALSLGRSLFKVLTGIENVGDCFGALRRRSTIVGYA